MALVILIHCEKLTYLLITMGGRTLFWMWRGQERGWGTGKIWPQLDLSRTQVSKSLSQQTLGYRCEGQKRDKELRLEDPLWLPAGGSISADLKIWLAKKRKITSGFWIMFYTCSFPNDMRHLKKERMESEVAAQWLGICLACLGSSVLHLNKANQTKQSKTLKKPNRASFSRLETHSVTARKQRKTYLLSYILNQLYKILRCSLCFLPVGRKWENAGSDRNLTFWVMRTC